MDSQNKDKYIARRDIVNVPINKDLTGRSVKPSYKNEQVLSEEFEQDKKLAEQSAGEVLYNTVKGFGSQALYGGLLQFVGNFNLGGIIDNGDSSYATELQRSLIEKLNKSQQETQIYSNPYDKSDNLFRGLGRQVQGAGLTAGIMSITALESVMLGLLTGGTGSGASLLTAARTMKNIRNMNNLKNLALGAYSGLKEANMNAAFTEDEVRQNYKQYGGFSDEEINKIASETAKKAFKAEILPMMVVNGLSFAAYSRLKPLGTGKSFEYQGVSGLAEKVAEGIGKTLPKMEGKVGKTISWVGGKVAGAAAEGFEEGYQNYISKKAQFNTDKKFGINKDLTLSDYIYNQEMTDNVLGGAFGSLFFGPLGRIASRSSASMAAKKFNEDYDTILKAGVKMFSDEFEFYKNLSEEVEPEYNTPLLLEKSRRTSNANLSMMALRFDANKGGNETLVFDERLKQMSLVLDAAMNNNLEVLSNYGIKEKEDIEFIKNTYPGLIEDSLNIKEKIKDFSANSIDYDSAERLANLDFIRKTNVDTLEKIDRDIIEGLSSPDINKILSPEIGRYVKLNAELKALKKTKTTPEKEEKIKILEEHIKDLKSETFDPENLTESQINNIESIGDIRYLETLYENKYLLKDTIDENSAEISNMSTPQKQLERKKERVKNEIVKNVDIINSKKGLEYLEKEAEKSGLLDETLKNQIDSKKLDIIAKENAKVTTTEEVKDEEIPPIVTKDVVESRKKNADSVASTKASRDLDDDIQKTFNDLFEDFEEQAPKRQDNPPVITEDLLGGFVADFKPVFVENNDMKDKFKGTIKKALDKNPDMSFEEFYASIYKYNPELADRAFNYLVEGWRDNGKVIENPEDIYKEYFASPEILELEEIFFNNVEKKDKKEIEKTNKVTSIEDAKESIKKAEELADKIENPTYEDVNDSEHIAEAKPKIPFLGLIYKVTYEGVKGAYYFEDNDVDLNRNGDSNLDIILNHRIFNEGTKFEIRISQNWADRKVSRWFIDKTGEITSKSITMRDWLIAKGFTEKEIATESFKNDKTKYDLWLSKVPMSMFFEGKEIGYGVHDTEWWNERNTANFRRKYPKEEAEIMQKELIAEGRKEAMRIRRGVAKGNTQMVITERRRGFAASVDEKLPRLTLSKTNPSAILCFMNDKGEVLVKMPDTKSVKVLDPSSIINADGLDNMDEGHAYMLTEADYKNGKPLYILNKIVTNDVSFQAKGNDAFRKMAESLQVVEIMRKILTGETKNPTASEIEKAKKLKKDIMELTDLNIADDKDIKKLRGLFPRQVMKNGEYVTTQDKEGRTVKMYNLSIQKGGFTRNTLPIIYTATNGDIIVKNYKSPISEQEGYEAFLKDHLTTQRRFFKINTEDGKTMSIAYPQPILDYNFQNPEKVEPTKEEDESEFTKDDEFFERGGATEEDDEILTDEVTPEIEEGSKEEIESILPGQKQRIVKHFLHNILKSLGEKDITYSDVVKELNNAFNRYSEELKNNPKYQREYEYLMKHKDELLGIGAYSKKFNTIREQLEVWIGEKIEEDAFDDNMSLETESETLKQYDASSFEYDMKNGLSSRLKRLFCGIPKTRQTLQKFGNIPEYYEADAIYDTLQYILADTPNSMEDFERKLLAKYESNKKAFEFLPEVLKRLKDTDIQFQKELLFRLNQTKNEMFMILVEDKDNGISVQAINANSKEPVLRLQNAFKEDFKNSDLVVREGEGYTVNKNIASKVIKTFEDWVDNNEDTKFKNVPVEDVKRWLDTFGIFVSEKTLQDIKNNNINSNIYEGRTWSSLFSKSGLLYKLCKNTKKLSAKTGTLSFNKDSENIVRYGIGGFLKDLAIVEVNNTVNNCSVMRIGGRNVMFFSQPNYVSEQLRKIKTNEAVLKNLSTAAFSKNSMLLSILNQKDEDGRPTDLSRKLKKILNISYVSLQALKIKGNKNSDKAGITDLASKDYEILIQAFMEAKGVDLGVEPISKINLVSSKMCFPPLSDSSQAFIIDTVKLVLTKANFDFGKDGELELDNNLLELLYSQLVLPDLERMNAYREAIKNGENINIEFQGIGSELFTSIAALNTLKVTGEKGETELLRHVKNGGKITEEIKSDIKKFLQSFIEHEAKAKKETWIKEGVIKTEDDKLTVLLDENYLNSKYPEGSLNSKTTIAALDFVINHYLNQAQIQMLFSGDFCNYTESLGKFGKAMGFKTGDLKGETDAEKFFYYMDSLSSEDREKAYVEYLKISSVNYFKRLKAQLSPGNRLAESKNKKYYQIIVNDEESVSSVVDSMIKLWYPDSYEKNEKNLKELNRIIKELEDENVENRLELETKYTAIVSVLKKDYPAIKDYFEIKYTDGQEFTTWKEHLDILLNQGKISEALYEIAKKKLTSQSKDGVNDENRLSEDEKKVIFQPIKPLHAGLYFENKGDYKLQRYVYIKTSSFPLLPEMTQGNELDKVRKNIEAFENSKGEDGRVRVVYRSGIKVGSTAKNISMNDLYNDDYEAIKDSIESSSLVLDRDNFSIQQDKPFKTDKHVLQAIEDSINMGTQIDKIIFGNGINTITEKVFPNLFDEAFLEEFEISKDGMLSGEELYDFYNKINIKEQNILRRNLLEKLGIADNTEWYNSEETLRKIEELLSDRLSNYQDAGIIGLRFKVLNEEGEYYYASESEVKEKKLKYESVEFNIPPWISPNSQKFESVLNSIVNNNIIKLKMTGGSSPVASSEGFQIRDYDNLTEEEKSGIILTENFKGKLKASEIVENGTKVRYAQVFLPCKLRTTYTDADGKKVTKLIDPRDYTKVVNGKTVLDFDRIDPEVLKFFSFRIPTSSHQSGTLIEVVGFLPHSMGDTMIVPKDHVTQIGEDFDIDVRYFYKYSTINDETGKIRRLKMSDIPLESAEKRSQDIYEEYRETKKSIKAERNQFISDLWKNNKDVAARLEEAKLELTMILIDKDTNQLLDNLLGTDYKEDIKYLEKEIESLESIILEDSTIKEKQKEAKKELDNYLETLKNSLTEEQKEVFKTYRNEKALRSLKQKVLENNKVAIYQSIYSAPNEGVQKRVNAVLSTDFANKTANLIEKERNSLIDSTFFSIYSDSVQKESLKSGASGKLGIAIHSNWVVFNSLMEQLPDELKVQLKEKMGEGFDDFSLVLGKNESRGILGSGKTFDGHRSIATVNMENQNCSTDNQKLGIMGKRNENPYTINEFALLCNLGFDQDNGLHIPSLFISQPILLRYVELKQSYDSQFSERISEADKGRLIDGALLKEFCPDLEVDEFGYFDNFDTISKTMGADTLVENLTRPNQEVQWATYLKFKKLQKASKNLTKVMQLLNIEKEGLGISFFDTIDKKNNLLNMFKDVEDVENDNVNETLSMKNVHNLFGVYLECEDISVEKEKEFLDKGFYFVEKDDKNISYYLKPTTAQNAKIINSLSLGYNLWKNIFPFEDRIISEQINKILKIANIDPNSKRGKDMKYTIASSMKDYIYSYRNKNLFEDSIEDERRKLFIDSPTNISLARKLSILKSKNVPLFELPFFKNLEFNVFKDGTKPSTIQYNVGSNSGINKNEAYTSLEGLLNSNAIVDESLGDYTEDDLLKDLIKYTLLADQEEGAVGFRNYLPIEALEKYKITNMLRVLTSAQNNKFSLLFNQRFIEQFFQHNYKEARTLSWSAKIKDFTFGDSPSWSKSTFINLKDDVERFDFYCIKNPGKKEYALYKHVGEGRYERIPILGGFGVNEYSVLNDVKESLYKSNNVPKSSGKVIIDNKRVGKSLTEGVSSTNVIAYIAKNSKNIGLKEIASTLQKYAGEGVKVFSNPDLIEKAGIEGLYTTSSNETFEKGNIYIDSSISKDIDTEKFQTVFIEEYIHSITSSTLKEWIQGSEIKLVNGEVVTDIKLKDGAPYYAIKMVSVYKQGVNALINNYTKDGKMTLEEAFEKINILQKAMKKDKDSKVIFQGYNTVEQENLYRVYNIEEFIAGFFVSPEFRKIMDKAEYKDTKFSLLEQFKDIIKKIFKSLNITPEKDSITEHAIDALFSMLDKVESNLTVINPHPDFDKEKIRQLEKLLVEDNKLEEAFIPFESVNTTKTPNAKGKMTFAYGINKRNDVTSKTTLEAVKNGERTATTRYESDGHIDYWKKLKIGDIIEWEGQNGEKVLVEVTKPLHKLVGSGKTSEQWSKLEGWSVEYFNNKVKPKLNEAWQIEYRYLNNKGKDGAAASNSKDLGATEKTGEKKENFLTSDIKIDKNIKDTIYKAIDRLSKKSLKVEALKSLTNALFDYIEVNNIPLNIIEAKRDNRAGGASMIYVNEEGTGYTIELDTKSPNTVFELLHELLHITTNHTFSYEVPDYSELNNQLEVYYDAFIKIVSNRKDFSLIRSTVQKFRDKRISREEMENLLTKEQLELYHATSSSAEFISSFISSESVQKELTSITIQDKTLFEELIKWVEDFLNKLFKGYSSVQEEEVIKDITKFIIDTKNSYKTPSQIISEITETLDFDEEEFTEVEERVSKSIENNSNSKDLKAALIDDDFQYYGSKEVKPISKEEADFFGDIDPNSGVDFKPKFEQLFTEGKVKTQGFYLTLEEFNSMTEEEQINFLNCL